MKRLVLILLGSLLGGGLLLAIYHYVTPARESELPPHRLTATPASLPANSRVSAATSASPARSAGDTLEPIFAEAQKALLSDNRKTRERFYASQLPALLSRQPDAAARLADSLQDGPVREEYLHRLAQAWAVLDQPAATAWADALSDGGERLDTLTDIVLTTAQTDAAAAVAYAEKYQLGGSELGSSRSGTWESLAALWSAQDLPAAAAWAVERPGGEVRELILSRVAQAWSRTEPGNAAQFVIDRMQPGLVQYEAAIAVLHEWALQDSPAAAAWVAAFPEGALRDRAQGELTGLAARPEAAAAAR